MPPAGETSVLDLDDALILAGLVLVVVGLALFSTAAAIIVAGLALVVGGIARARVRKEPRA